MLGNDLLSVRVGGVRALKNLVREHYDEYQGEVLELLGAYYLSRASVNMAGMQGRAGMSTAETQEALIREQEEQLEEKEREKVIIAISAIKEYGERIESERRIRHLMALDPCHAIPA